MQLINVHVSCIPKIVHRQLTYRCSQARFKSSKFEIRPEELQTLEAELGALAAPGLRANLFAKDFKKQVSGGTTVTSSDQPVPTCCMAFAS
jgi:hypothetical protein